jgi:hypothetical protein
LIRFDGSADFVDHAGDGRKIALVNEQMAWAIRPSRIVELTPIRHGTPNVAGAELSHLE